MQSGSDSRPSGLEHDCEQHKELVLELAEEPKTSLTDRIRDVEHENEKLERDKSLLVKKVHELKASLCEKRERLWDEIQDFQDALGEKKKELQEALDSKAEHRREASALRQELASLQEQQTCLSQATAKSNEEARQATAKQVAQQEELASLRQLLRSQQTSFSQFRTQAYEKATHARQEQAILQETVTQLEQRLQEQSKAFETERAQLLKQATRSQNAQGELGWSLDQAMPHLRSLLAAYDRIRGCSADKQTKTTASPHSTCMTLSQASIPDLAQRLQEQQLALDREREKLSEHASEATKTQQDITLRALMEREAVLTCPISLELFEFPVVTGCCGKTFSSEALRQAVKQSPLCPLCRGRLSSTHPNRDMTKLIELHKAERSVLGVPEPAAPSSAASQNNGYARIPTGSSGHAHRSRRSTGSSSTPESRHRDNRGERVQARSAVPYLRSSRSRTQANASLDATSIALPTPSVSTVADTAAAATSQQARSSPSGRTVTTIDSGGTRTPVPRHMMRSVPGSMRFPSAQSRSTARGRRHRSRSRTASSAVISTSAHTGAQQQTLSAASRRRALRTGAVSSAALRTTTTAVSISGSQSRERSTISRPNTSTALGVPISAASVGTILAALPLPPMNPSQTTRSSTAVGPVASMDAYMNAWLRAHPAPAAASPPTSTADISQGQMSRPNAVSTTASTAVPMSSPVLVSSAARMAASTSTSATATGSHRQARMFASQDDLAVGRQHHDSLRLTASQPAPREPLSVIAKSISSLRDLLGSDFEDSDSNSN